MIWFPREVKKKKKKKDKILSDNKFKNFNCKKLVFPLN